MTTLRQEAYHLLSEFDESEMTGIVTLLKNYKLRTEKNHDIEEGLEGLNIINSFAGRLPKDFNEEKELEEGLKDKYGNFS